ncbi:ANTAR domain-containing protein [Actinoplanes sp. SE50]|uniref:GAF domain-containing protein n=1 Tax=unclassified Actinoplanes TaxID=2626549 RepID=UPI00023EC929|nr:MULTISPECIES: GAF domain-containing protein [unclassified Actinoplanes]AEV83147.1 ANTAR domain protein with unknown sensor [Actinoplanes sp. SE50/110]ATO81541.1 ANTAR domain-containing protein [Actinoplanes sp. SE50]SLL98948.1 ANTAR domain-containing protein [Actinoplanes sp. SE50/110]
MATSQHPEHVTPHHRPLADAIVGLAETPDHVSGVEIHLKVIAALAADRVAAADYASVTTLQGDEYTTVAASSDIASAVDEAQIADGAGPCLQALETGEPVGVTDTRATMDWPGFHAVAPALGLQASVSVPLYIGRSTPIAVLNLYGRDSSTMEPLIVGVAHLYATSRELALGIDPPPVRDPGAAKLLDGYARALAVRTCIQRAVRLLTELGGHSSDDAYTTLCERAAEHGNSLSVEAKDLIHRK